MRYLVSSLLAMGLVANASSQIIDFETLPDGTPTADRMQISDQYAVAPFGVSFRLLNRVSGHPQGFPQIAKVGPPLTAFQGCSGGADRASIDAGVCSSFLTDDSSLGIATDLEVTYTTPIARASGVMIDVDRREEWTISAYDASGALLTAVVLTPPPVRPCGATEGNGASAPFSLESSTGAHEIQRLVFHYSGSSSLGSVGLAFDNFNPTEAGLGVATVGCIPVASSRGIPAVTSALGSDEVQDNSLRLIARGLPLNAMGYFIASPIAGFQMNPAGATGNICILHPSSRFNRPGELQQSGSCGTFDLMVNVDDVPGPLGATSLLPGETWTFQAWYQDPLPQPNSNFASAVTVDFR
ncbi:MAG: hypothetical protein AAGG01_08555 [Planctomycetota bacterium]